MVILILFWKIVKATDLQFNSVQYVYYGTVWKSAIKSDHDFCGKINIFFVKSTLLDKEVTKELISRKIFERDRVL